MVKPRLIILIRHAQSEGNKNRDIHQMIPDHRVKLTEDGWRQAEEAGRRLKTLLRPEDTLQIYTSPYRRTRETTEGILSTLTAPSPPSQPPTATTSTSTSTPPPANPPTQPPAPTSPQPFPRSRIKVYEEPRLREQDFGNFQPCSAEMNRMWQERADYGHFFYRIPNGESAADAYDRISGFNESLWRQFGEKEEVGGEAKASVYVLVTHGLMARVFLMKWYHWSVEYFEDLRNVNHCEFVTLAQDASTGKFVLENQLRTWSELKRLKKAEQARDDPQRRNTLSAFLAKELLLAESPRIPARQWGGCAGGCDHQHEQYPRRKAGGDVLGDVALPAAAVELRQGAGEGRSGEDGGGGGGGGGWDTDVVANNHNNNNHDNNDKPPPVPVPTHLLDDAGASTPHEMSDAEEYFDAHVAAAARRPQALARPEAMARPDRKATVEDLTRWANESGMGRGGLADALGDGEEEEEYEGEEVVGLQVGGGGGSVEWRSEAEVADAEREDRSIAGGVY
ncbi:hypothetical protein LTR08_006323 [Meristemomyces frigidus]|nr:hypothetical protein LTR08_006323 [Meristemomyces frigidus]